MPYEEPTQGQGKKLKHKPPIDKVTIPKPQLSS